jgi:hypothetical protein
MDVLLFLYFFTLSADLLHLEIGLFKVKINHLVALLLGICVFTRKKTLMVERKLFLSFCFILGSMVFSALFSPYFNRCLGYLFVYLYHTLFYFIIPFNLILREDAERVLKLYFLSFICVGVFAFLQFGFSLGGIDLLFVQQKVGFIARPNAFSYEPSYYALYMTIFVMFWNARQLLDATSFSSKKIVCFLFVNSLLLVSTAASAFFSYFIFAAVFLTFSLKDYPWAKKNFLKASLLWIISFLCTAFIFWSFFLTTFLKFFSFEFYLHHSFAERWQGIENCWQLFLTHPFFGVGLGGISPWLFQEESGRSSFYELEEISLFEPSNALTEMLASLGLVGLFSFIFLAFIFLRKFFQVLKNSLIDEDKKKLAIALFISLVTLLLTLQFNQGLFRSYIWVHAALTYGYLNLSANAKGRI